MSLEGSNPSLPATCPSSSADRALPCGGRGQRFKSSLGRQQWKSATTIAVALFIVGVASVSFFCLSQNRAYNDGQNQPWVGQNCPVDRVFFCG